MRVSPGTSSERKASAPKRRVNFTFTVGKKLCSPKMRGRVVLEGRNRSQSRGARTSLLSHQPSCSPVRELQSLLHVTLSHTTVLTVPLLSCGKSLPQPVCPRCSEHTRQAGAESIHPVFLFSALIRDQIQMCVCVSVCV